jgi:hypothetical protein
MEIDAEGEPKSFAAVRLRATARRISRPIVLCRRVATQRTEGKSI